ncbi:FAD-dependent oxidoreductase [Mesorhizobium sp. M7A.F.Ca.CA.001.09.2.1]|uniref:FAD-dependent oxidoreductase n=10 Tax=Mesorhizobium TaxID=68287 RepID=A0AB38T4W5_9HYPH|nr:MULTISPECIES: FAD-dependent oxidoreductase [Mesorhizobium]MDF3212974.1 FAD-dependent oxidoreductase [Mesorhizobium ciceri]RUY68260.1 FAD-dependent oxidoreductase [Mesorhizobium sp. M7A.F.Ca.CA.001.13.1.1]RUY70612.1 FAD-dependent oxidoreductase [Mesorhizobium sp. M7A.F.Ca.CA.001.05.1.1]RUY74878.1 FAD-dependent oxidoreductase [Mesorhizobium sp. M7A.F.Ca.CA.001.09.2.1]RUZ01545.1 FAD-dependent oxidoreductase [Mesorhizobium sp. M7A.F.Ca.CA.001.04.2.1]
MIAKAVPAKARAVIIGGGVSGCSVAYHLAKLGWTDIVLLERKQLTSGTTWHAAGLIGQLRGSQNMTRLAKYSADLYVKLEAETEVGTGMRQVGSITVALTEERKHEIYRQASLARAFDVDVREISPREVSEMYPHLNVSDVVGAVHLPLDGQCDPANIAMALAKGARQRGATIVENVKVTKVHSKAGRVTGVSWTQGEEQGTIEADIVVNCAGMWARELGAQNGVTIPLHACEHFYLVTEPIPGLTRLPVLRVPDECAYYKEDAGKMMLGAFEPVAKPWGMDGIREDFCFDQLPEDMEHFEPILEMGVNRMPMLATAGIHTFFNGPESFTPDDRYYLGEAPELSGYWMATGYNSIGIVSSGGAGMALAQWINDGEAPFDLWEVDIRRAQPFQKNRRYLKERVSETLGLLYADHFPYRQMATSRNVRRSPLHEHLKARGAVFGEVAGWERANWFAREGQEREYRYSWKRQNWFDNQREEHLAVRNGVGLFDMTSFGKIRVEGRDACAFLQRLCANDMDVAPGKIVYTQMLNKRGGIESDLTVSRLSETAYFLVVPGATLQRDLAWLRKHVADEFVVVTDVTAAESVLCLMGPDARKLIQKVSPNDFSNEKNPFGTFQEIEIGMGLARAHRVTYVGELGWELYVSTDQAAHVFEAIEEAGADVGLKLCGLHTLDSCRIEKAFRHFGHDITDEDNVLEAGLGFAVKTAKGDFIGRDAVLRKKEAGLSRRLVQFRLKDPEPLLFHNEAILRDGKIVGPITSGNYGHHLGGAVGLGYVPCEGESEADVLASSYEIEIAGERFAAEASLKPMYDPKSERSRM